MPQPAPRSLPARSRNGFCVNVHQECGTHGPMDESEGKRPEPRAHCSRCGLPCCDGSLVLDDVAPVCRDACVEGSEGRHEPELSSDEATLRAELACSETAKAEGEPT